jgi:CHAT domain-containing protein
MAQRRGRDERVGFVRAAFEAGAAAVVAARWTGEDLAAAGVLDRFGRYLRYLPRDVALHRAQVDLCADEPELAHPARWGCWTLYGDPGWQTGAGALRRVARRELDRFRSHHRRTGVVPDQR